jgi:hypothetical protein
MADKASFNGAQASVSPSKAHGVPANWAHALVGLAKLKMGWALALRQPSAAKGAS